MEPKPDLNDLEILCAVIEHGSFRAAADRVGTSQPTVSRAIARLEARLDQPLIRRNSRSVSPTQLGVRYAEHARRLLREYAEVEAELLSKGGLTGPLSLSAPPALGRRIFTRLLADFCADHPTVQLSITYENRRVDLVDDSVDVAIRFGPLAPTWHRQRLLLDGQMHVYGSPKWTELGGLPIDRLLDNAPCLVLHSTHLRDRWPFVIDGQPKWHDVMPALKSNDADSLIAFAVLGTGITLLPDFIVRPEVERGELVRLNPEESGTPIRVFAVTMDERRSERVESLLDHLTSAVRAGLKE